MRYRFPDSQMVLLVVGQEMSEISIDENVLFDVSPVFKAAFNSTFRESHERSMYLPDNDATIMDILIQCLYALKSRVNKINKPRELLRLYVLADKYDIVKVKNQTCKRLLSWLESRRRKFSSKAMGQWWISYPLISEVEFVYENTTSTAPMRRLLVDWFVWGIEPTWFDDDGRSRLQSVPEFAVDVCAVLAGDFNKRSKDRLFMRKPSLYLEKEPAGDKSQIN